MSTVGSRIKRAREAAGLNQIELGRACGLSRAAVSQWENGATKSPTPENIFAIADATGFSARWLATGKGPERVDTTAPIAPVVSEYKTQLPPYGDELLKIMENLTTAARYRILALAHEEAGTDAKKTKTEAKA